MKNIFCFLLSLIITSSFAFGQQQGAKISELPTYSGSLSSNWVPVSVGNATYKVNGTRFAEGKLNASDTSNKWITSFYKKANTDSVFYIKGSTTTFAFVDAGQSNPSVIFFGKNNSDDSTILILSDGTRLASSDNSSYSNAPLTFDGSDFTSPVTYDGLIARNAKINENKYALKSDLFADSSNTQWKVDKTTKYPNCNDHDGNSYLISTDPPLKYFCAPDSLSNPFYGNKNKIARNIGGTLTFYQPAVGDLLDVINSKTSGSYKYQSDSIWHALPKPDLNGGNNDNYAPKFGSKNSKNAYLIAGDSILVELHPDGTISLPFLANKTHKSIHLTTDSTGLLLIATDTALAAVDPIVIDTLGRINFRKNLLDSIRGGLFGGSGTVAWGAITGTLSNQTDLQTALNAKEAVANKSTTTTLGTSNTLYPTQNAVKTYVDNGDAAKENALGNPPTNGYVLSSTTTGTRSWVAPGSSGGSQTTNKLNFTLTAGQSAVTIAGLPSSTNDFDIFYNGMYLPPSFYSISGTTLTFTFSNAVAGDRVDYAEKK